MAILSPNDGKIEQSLKNIEDTLQRITDAISKSVNNNLGLIEDSAQQRIKDQEKATKKNLELEEKAGEAERKKGTDHTEKLTAAVMSAFNSAFSGMSSLLDKYEGMLKSYTNTRQQMSFNLLSSGITYDTVVNALDVLGTNAYVRQQRVYENLTNLVSSGITMNAAQRAFLQTASDQVSLGFSATEQGLNRLIRLQQMDLSEARMAQMAGLKQFLEQNYQNSQYIKEGFTSVSNALIEMQSLMSANAAMATEKSIQTYLGAFSSLGGGAGNSIAAALNQIGSGDFNLGNMQNLMVMAASRSGLSYADLLNNGLDAARSEQLLQGMFSYIASMGNVGGGSNVAMNAMARMFGLNVSDIRAASQMDLGLINTNYDTSIAQFLSDFANSSTKSSRLSTLFDNMLSNRAIGGDLMSFQINRALAGMLGDTLTTIGSTIGGAKGAGLQITGGLASNMQALGLLAGLVGDATEGAGGFGKLFNNVFTFENLKQIKKGGIGGIISGMVDSLVGNISNGTGDLLADYNSLGNNWFDGGMRYTSTGEFVSSSRGNSQSGRITNREREYTTIKFENDEELPEEKTLDDLYNLLADDFPTTTWATVANISSANNGVQIVDSQTTTLIVDALTLTAVSTENILMLLENAFAGKNYALTSIPSLGLTHQ